jgi:superfamily I DNA/RNA helicase
MLRSKAPSLVPKTCVPFLPVEAAPRVVLRSFWQPKAETDWIAASIAAQREAGMAYSDMAVLVRTQVRHSHLEGGRAG